ncbi:hypothetical protein IFM89_008398 [Coptis chinensis]|uniref:Bifunctional inhibitor/plant lipid transfer protein/seed storage helical domain-containing protein n=2 Tax=Coptis chinensis TaxID=261450 RepID=A0A835HBX4_9MAGN|nr:hypothetical protein IFM89_008398 [Coptis chinensis]
MAMKLKSHCLIVEFFMMLMLVFMMVDYARCDDQKQREECSQQLIGLATCLDYVGGQAKAPTPDCCKGMNTVLAKSKKCLCLLVKNRNDPSLGLKVNATLALNLPSICKSDVSIADCPALLGLAPNSTDAQVFKQFERSLHNKTSSSSTGNSTATGSTASGNTSTVVGLKFDGLIALLCFALIFRIGA